MPLENIKNLTCANTQCRWLKVISIRLKTFNGNIKKFGVEVEVWTRKPIQSEASHFRIKISKQEDTSQQTPFIIIKK